METSNSVAGGESSLSPPYWALLGLSGAGFLETAYLTAVSASATIASVDPCSVHHCIKKCS